MAILIIVGGWGEEGRGCGRGQFNGYLKEQRKTSLTGGEGGEV